MRIKELVDGSKNVEVTGQIIKLENVVDGAGWQRRNATLSDGTNTILLVLWNEDCVKVNLKDTVKIEKGYVKDYKGSLQLSTGKYGKLTVVESEPVELVVPKKFTQCLPEGTIINVEYSRKICPEQFESLGVGASVKVPVEMRDDAYLVLVDFVEEKLARAKQ